MLSAMQEDDELIWSLYGSMPPRKRGRLLRTLRRQYACDLTIVVMSIFSTYK